MAIQPKHPLIVIQTRKCGIPSTDKFDSLCTAIEADLRDFEAKVVWVYPVERRDMDGAIVPEAWTGKFKYGVAVPEKLMANLKLSQTIEYDDVHSTKSVSRAAGDYVVMGDDFCAGGCGRVRGHAHWCAFAPKSRVDKKGSSTPFPGTVGRHIADYTMQVTRAHATEVGGRLPINVGEHYVARVPIGKACGAFRAKALFPGRK